MLGGSEVYSWPRRSAGKGEPIGFGRGDAGTSTAGSPAAPLLACEAQVIPAAVTGLLHGALGGDLTKVLSALRSVPVLGSGLAARLTSCVRTSGH